MAGPLWLEQVCSAWPEDEEMSEGGGLLVRMGNDTAATVSQHLQDDKNIPLLCKDRYHKIWQNGGAPVAVHWNKQTVDTHIHT